MLAVTGGFPTARFGHRAVLLETQVVVFGGYNGARKRERGEEGQEKTSLFYNQCDVFVLAPAQEILF